MQGELSASRGSLSAPSRNEVTDIIPFNEFGMLDDLDFSANSHFDKEAQVLRAPELDDLDDTDNLVVMKLAGPSVWERRIDPLGRDAHRGKNDAELIAMGKDPLMLWGARTDALYGAWLCGAALGGTSMALHHKLCHVLGGSFDTPHAETHAILLPHTIGFNSAKAADLLAPISQVLGGTPGVVLFDFAASLEARTKLKDFGLGEAELERAADIAVKNPYWNPRPFDRASLLALLRDAWEGRRPPQ